MTNRVVWIDGRKISNGNFLPDFNVFDLSGILKYGRIGSDVVSGKWVKQGELMSQVIETN